MKEHRCLCTAAGHCRWHQAVTDADSFSACRNGTPPQPAETEPCLYLSNLRTHDFVDGQPVYECLRHGACTLLRNDSAKPACADCKDRLPLSSPDLASKFLDPLRITTRDKVPTDALRGMLAGGSAFLVCGGPSVRSVDYGRLSERGIFSLGINNVAGFVPVSAFACSDPPMKFHWAIFADPKIMKFLPTPKRGRGRHRGKLREKRDDGEFYWLDTYTGDCPNVWGFERRSWLMPDHTFFTDVAASWGNQNDGVNRTGEEKTACTMLLGFRLLYHLGARTIFLLGADFRMNPAAGLKDNYAFQEDRDANAVESNNRQFSVANDWLSRLRPVFERFGLSVYNTNPLSYLRAFDHVPFDEAVRLCKGAVPEEPFDLDGWYSKQTKE